MGAAAVAATRPGAWYHPAIVPQEIHVIGARSIIAVVLAFACAGSAHAQRAVPARDVPQTVRVFVAKTYWSVDRCVVSQPSLATRLKAAIAALKADNAMLVPADAWGTAALEQATLDQYNANSPEATELLCTELATRLEGEKFRAAFKKYVEISYK